MIHADNLSNTHIQDNNEHWHVAKPIKFSSIFSHFIDAWKVLIGDYVAVKFWSNK